MIYLPGGPMRVGKSIIARRVRERAGISVISTDDIIRMLKEGAPQLGIDFEMEIPVECDALWPFLHALASIRLQRNEPLLIEGEGISPPYAAKASNEFPLQIRACFVGDLTINTTRKLQYLRAFSDEHGDWLAGQSPETYRQIVSQIVAISQQYKRDCDALGIAFFDMSQHFEESVAEVVDFLLSDSRSS